MAEYPGPEIVEAIAYSIPSEWLTDDHHWDIAVKVIDAIRSLPVAARMDVAAMVEGDPGYWVEP